MWIEVARNGLKQKCGDVDDALIEVVYESLRHISAGRFDRDEPFGFDGTS